MFCFAFLLTTQWYFHTLHLRVLSSKYVKCRFWTLFLGLVYWEANLSSQMKQKKLFISVMELFALFFFVRVAMRCGTISVACMLYGFRPGSLSWLHTNTHAGGIQSMWLWHTIYASTRTKKTVLALLWSSCRGLRFMRSDTVLAYPAQQNMCDGSKS